MEVNKNKPILETNSLILGSEQDYVKQLARFVDKLYVRVSVKAATPEGFTQRTGALGDCFYELPFKALKYLLDERIYTRAAGMTDLRVMPREEREILIRKLSEIEPGIARDLEERQPELFRDLTVFGFAVNPWRFWRWKEIKRQPAV